MSLDGGCLCGGTRYAVASAPTSLNDCHCIDCRRASGAPYVSWGSVPRTDLGVTAGSVRRIPHATRIRSFAACCGTQLFFEDNESTASVDVTIASLDHPESFAPSRVIWTEDKLPWVRLNEALPSFAKSSSPDPNPST